VHHLINAPEMFLRTIYQLEEEGVPPIQVRLAECLGQSPPVVGATISRMRRDGLVEIAGRRLELTDAGRRRAVEVVLSGTPSPGSVGSVWPPIPSVARIGGQTWCA
jgi:DtxR family Mn-dependent transcriptional regulator